MMLGLDVKLITPKELPMEYIAKIEKDFPKAFQPISTSWYGYAPQVIRGALRNQRNDVAMTDNDWKKIHSAFYVALNDVKIQDERYDRIGLPGLNMWGSFDVLSHFGDIMFAAHHMILNGHVVTIEYKEC